MDSRLNVSSTESEMLDLYFSTVADHPNFVSLIVTTILNEGQDRETASESEFSPYLITVSGTYNREITLQEAELGLSVRYEIGKAV